jgi:hypothetical protein
MRLATLSAIALAAVLCAAQSSVWRDKAGNMSVENLTSWLVTQVSDTDVRLVGKGTPAAPVRGIWRSQGFEVRAQRLECLARRNKAGAYEMVKGEASGDCFVTLVGGDRGALQTTVRTEVWRYDGEERKLSAPGRLEWSSLDSAAGWRFELTGSGGEATLWDPASKRSFPARVVEVRGPIQMSWTSTRPPKEKGGQPSTITIRGRADSVRLDDEARTVTLSGNVSASGDEDPFAGSMVASKVVLHYDAERRLTQIEGFGEPGITRAREKGGGG